MENPVSKHCIGPDQTPHNVASVSGSALFACLHIYRTLGIFKRVKSSVTGTVSINWIKTNPCPKLSVAW